MAKYKPIELVKSYHGKVCSHSDTYFAEKNGTLYTGKICNPFKGEPTDNQVAVRNLFKQTIANVKALTTEQKAEYAAAFKKYPGKCKSLNGYMFKAEYAKLVAEEETPEDGE
ncbi:MAG: hypothetical protein MJZ53_02000 [Paludibacteraceae bacterium]|nr:hypothetical protein [Paludibacteraceae bacterium]